MTNNIYLIGFMAVGKTTVAESLHRLTGYELLDTDAVIVAKTGRSIPDIFSSEGEAGFRKIETRCLEEVSLGNGQIISCGGGVAIQPANVKIMHAHGTCILLEAKAETILKRVADDDNRPLLKGRKSISGIQSLMEERLPYYRKAADLVVSVDGKSPEEIAKEICYQLGIATDI